MRLFTCRTISHSMQRAGNCCSFQSHWLNQLVDLCLVLRLTKLSNRTVPMYEKNMYLPTELSN